MKHTKEPWRATYEGVGEWKVREDSSYEVLADVYSDERGYMENQQANARRIVLCVNACAGITNEALEKGIVMDSVKLHEAILDQQPSSFFKEYGVKVWEDV